FFAGASLLALRLGPDRLGPDRARAHQRAPAGLGTEVRGAVGQTLRAMVDGGRYLIARVTPGAGLAVMGVHRFLCGLDVSALILISRNLVVDPDDGGAGLATFGVLGGISLAGNGAAILASPAAHQRLTPGQWVLVCLGVGAVSQL